MKFLVEYREAKYCTAEVYADTSEKAKEKFIQEWESGRAFCVDESGLELDIYNVCEDNENENN